MSPQYSDETYVDNPPTAEAAFVSGRNMLQEERRVLNEMLDEVKSVRKAGGDPEAVIMRQQKKWSDADVQLSIKIKEMGNKAFKAGNMQQAYMLYSACLCGMYSAPDATYWLNRAAVCLKLKAYVHAESNATNAYEDGKAAQPVAVKALYRRAQARRYLGKLTEAKDDLKRALELSPNETSLLSEEAELRKIQDKTPEELQTWLMKSKGVKLPMEGMKAKRVLEEAEKLRSLVEFGPVN